jgi:hypothetical protein
MIPAEILKAPVWLRWKLERRPDEPKPRKVPYYANGRRRNGTQGSEQDRAHLVTHEVVERCRNGYRGIGHALLPDLPVTVVDLDRCVIDGKLHPDAAALAQGTYAEFSPSGTGLHVYFAGKYGADRKQADREPFGVEVFDSKGYVAFTGKPVPGAVTNLLSIEAVRGTLDAWLMKDSTGTTIEAPLGDTQASGAPSRQGWTVDRIRTLIFQVPADLPRADWLRGLAAIHHETGGSTEGLDLAVEWSSTSETNYVGREDVEARWESFKRSSGPIATLDPWLAGHGVNATMPEDFEDLTRAPAPPEDFDDLTAPIPYSNVPRRLNLQELANTAPIPPRFIVPDWLPEGEVTLLAGHGGIGKSQVALLLLACIALGLPWCGVPTSRKRCAYFSFEDSERALHWRLAAICAHLCVDLNALDGWLDVYDGTDSDSVMFEQRPHGARTRAPYKWMVTTVRESGAEVLALDGAADVFAANENSRSEVKAFVRALRAAVPHTGAALLISHVDKATAQSNGETSQGYSGSTAWHNSVRSRWFLFQGNAQGAVTLELKKANYARGGRRVGLRWDAEAKLHLPDGLTIADREIQELEQADRVLALIREASDRGEPIPAAWSGARTAAAVLLRSPGLPPELANKKDLRRIVDQLLRAGRVVTAVARDRHRNEVQRLVPAVGASNA